MSEQLDAAIAAAQLAGAIQRAEWTQPSVIREEEQRDIKLATDVHCEEAIRETLLAAFPAHAMLGEEGGGIVVPDTPTWIVDPLDGTMNYARRIPHFCTSIALEVRGEVVVGVIFDPLRDELFTAEAGQGAYLNGTPMHVSTVDALSDAIATLGFAKTEATIAAGMRTLHDMAPRVRKIRLMGAAALDLAYIAAGRTDLFWECGLQRWDIAAGSLLIREAGGRITVAPARHGGWDVRADNGRLPA